MQAGDAGRIPTGNLHLHHFKSKRADAQGNEQGLPTEEFRLTSKASETSGLMHQKMLTISSFNTENLDATDSTARGDTPAAPADTAVATSPSPSGPNLHKKVLLIDNADLGWVMADHHQGRLKAEAGTSKPGDDGSPLFSTPNVSSQYFTDGKISESLWRDTDISLNPGSSQAFLSKWNEGISLDIATHEAGPIYLQHLQEPSDHLPVTAFFSLDDNQKPKSSP